MTVYEVVTGEYADECVRYMVSDKGEADRLVDELEKCGKVDPRVLEVELDWGVGHIARPCFQAFIDLKDGTVTTRRHGFSMDSPDRDHWPFDITPHLSSAEGVFVVTSYVSKDHAKQLAIGARKDWFLRRNPCL